MNFNQMTSSCIRPIRECVDLICILIQGMILYDNYNTLRHFSLAFPLRILENERMEKPQFNHISIIAMLFGEAVA